MRRDLEQMNAKNQKMERDCKFLQQLVYEQTKTIKALNVRSKYPNFYFTTYVVSTLILLCFGFVRNSNE